MRKRGISPVIATVLIVSLVLVIGTIVLIWATGYVRERTARAELEVLKKEMCDRTAFVVEDVCYDSGTVENIETGEIETIRRIRFMVGNDNPQQPIYSFLVFVDYTGRRVISPSLPHEEIAGFGSGLIVVDLIEERDVDRLRITPKLKSEENFFNCEEKELVVEGGEIVAC